MTIQTRRHWHLRASFFIAFLLVISPLVPTITKAQGPNSSDSEEIDPTAALSQILRLERVEVAGGAELITVHAKLVGLSSQKSPLRTTNGYHWCRFCATLWATIIRRTIDCATSGH